ncbi:MAG: capsular biosynthesis protein [Leptolyngbya sp. DLM2.Bin15]|nr:MAG: capsular biosynthesis protein [Leptolyngbya sp. DLM2.Bin15]
MQQSPASYDDLNTDDPKGGLKLGPYIRMIKRNLWIVVGTTLLLGGAAFVKSTSSVPTYQAGFRLLVEPVTAEARLVDPSALTRNGGGINRGQEIDYPTQLEILKSPAMLWPIYEQVSEQFPEFAYIQLQNDLVVERSPQTKIIEVTFLANDPNLVQKVLDETSAKYLQYSLEERKTRIGEGINFIEAQRPSLEARTSELQDRLQDLQQRFFVSNPENESAQLTEQLRGIVSQQVETSQSLREQREYYASLQRQLNLTPNQAIAASTLSEEPGYQALLAQFRELEAQIAVESARFTELSPTIQSLREQQNNIAGLMNATAQSIIGPALGGESSNPEVQAFQNTIRRGLIQQMVDTANLIELLEVRQDELGRLRSAAEDRVQDFPAIAREYNEIQRDLEITTQALDQLLAQRETLRLEAAQSTVPWEVLSAPQIPLDENGEPVPESSSPIVLLAGIMGGAMLGAGLAFLLEKYRDIYHVVEDIEDAVPVPVLSVVPPCPFANQVLFYSPESSNLRSSEQSSIVAFQEAFSELFAGLRFQQSGTIQSLAVCSATMGDGTSTIAANLAQTLASSGKRVLLVDANFRDPRLHEFFGLSNGKGLGDLLKSSLEPEAVIRNAPTAEHLSILTSGTVMLDAPKLLGSPRMEAVSDRLAEMFDVVIYDAPPLRDYMDTVFLSDHVDGVLMAVALRRTKQSAVNIALEKLQEYSISLVGVVANSPLNRHRPIQPSSARATSEEPLWMKTGISGSEAGGLSIQAAEGKPVPHES